MKDNTQLIDSYLLHEMSEVEKAAFENRLATDNNLQQELNVQRQIIEAANRAGIKASFAKAIKQKVFYKNMFKLLAITSVVVVAALLFFNWHNWFGNKEEKANPFVQQFTIDIQQDTIIETHDGIVFAIPANAFKTTQKNIEIKIQTALTPAAIIKQGLSTTSNGALLQTAGMFSINGIANGDTFPLQKEIQVSVPSRNINPAMQLFDGVKDATGNINWVNPKPISRQLRTYDITTLNFYPSNYLPTLKALGKDVTNKKYTDSLYYSFSGWPDYKQIVHSPKLYPHDTSKKDEYIEQMNNQYPDSMIPSNSMVDNQQEYYIHEYDVNYEINPAKIKAIWNKKFNNTILATKEFEERLQYFHTLCTDELLNIYIQNIDKSLNYTDELILRKINEADENPNSLLKEKFTEFAKRKDGSVILAQGMQQKLNIYFQNKYKAYQLAIAKTQQDYKNKLKQLDAIADEKGLQHQRNNVARDSANFQNELCANLADAYKQIGVTKNCNDTILPPPSDNYYNVTITTTGWKNLDAYVLEATSNRQSVTYTDPITGKTASVTYKECSIEITNQKEFDKVLVYLIPSGLNSFQRMNFKEGIYKENLNMLFSYDAIVVGYKGTNTFFAKQEKILPQQYKLTLTSIAEPQLNAQLNAYSKTTSISLLNEFTYQLYKQQEVDRKMQLQKDEEFRIKVAKSIFNCFDGEFMKQ